MNLRILFQIFLMGLIILTISCNTTFQNKIFEKDDPVNDSQNTISYSEHLSNENQEPIIEDITIEEEEIENISATDEIFPVPEIKSNIEEEESSPPASAPEINGEIKKEPCWITNDPNQCLSENETKTYYYVSAFTSCKNLDEKQSRNMLQSLLAKAFIEELSSTIFSKFVQKEQCYENRECEMKISNEIKIIAEDKIIPSRIYLMDTHKKNDGKDETIYGLGQISKNFYQKRLKAINESYSSKTIKKAEKKNRLPIIPSPNDQDCEQVHLNMKSIKDQSRQDVITMIQDDFITKYKSNLNSDGEYSSDVLETDSEMMKPQNKGKDFDQVEAEIERKFNNNLKCWQSESKDVEFEYLENVRKSLAKINEQKNLINSIKNHLNKWEFAVKRITALEQQHDTFNTYYNKKLAILSYYHLTFTVSMSNIRKNNILFMRFKENALAKKTLIDNGIVKNIKSVYHEIDDFYNSTLQTSYSVRITPEYFASLSFNNGKFRGRLRKFKIDFVDSQDEKDSITEPIQVDDGNVESFVILSNDELDVDCGDIFDSELNNTQNLINKCTCSNKHEIIKKSISYLDNKLESFPILRLQGSARNKANELINEVVNDNCRSLREKQVIQLRKKYKLNQINNQIKEEELKIKNINILFKDKLSIKKTLPTKLKKGEKFKDYQVNAAPFKQNLENSIRDYEELTRKQPIIANVILEGSYDIGKVDEFINERIERKVMNKIPDFCPDVNWGQKLIHNQRLIKDQHKSVSSIPELVEYSIPQIKLLPREERDSIEFTVPIFFKINCTTQSHMFKYHPEQNEIEDLNKGYLWKIYSGTHPQILRRRKKDENTHSFPSISDPKAFNLYFKEYQNFCKAYSTYRNSIIQVFDFNEYPEIKCLNRYEKMNDHNFRDYVRLEHWQIKRKSSYYDLVAATKKTDWMMNTLASFENLFYDLKESFQNGSLDTSIIQMLSGKAFWTNERISRNSKTVVIFDFSMDYLIEEPKKTNEKCYGLVTRKISFADY